MAKGKGKQKSTAPSRVETVRESKQEATNEPDPERFTAFEYLVVNALLWLFCIVNFFVAKWFMGEATGLVFFFSVIAVGFSAACLISYLHDRFYRDDLTETESP